MAMPPLSLAWRHLTAAVGRGYHAGMDDPAQQRLEMIRKWRTRPEPDLSLGFLGEFYKREVEKPAAQLADLAELWVELVPVEIVRHTRLESFSRGVMRVAVDSSVQLYELDRLLRSGLQTQLIQAHKGPALRRIQLKVSQTPIDDPEA
jgi:hypothetical protein